MPRTKEENERIRQAAKEKIHAAAMTLFIQKGYHATSIDDVAKQANISKGLLYNYYKGKEELLAVMVQLRIEEVRAVMETAASLANPMDQLCYIVNGAIDHVHRNPAVYRFYLNLQTQPENDHVLAAYSEQLNQESSRQFEVQCQMFERLGAKEPKLRSLSFSAALHGTMQMMTMYTKGFPVEQMKQQMISEYCALSHETDRGSHSRKDSPSKAP
ncbi:TetR/AcrR family transcriptional regulator [Paenibacillus sp. 1001270B_150601_E10]|uniref:TetR/AcrR family transcriptional regulator n=1 Tax=Paenibacillus sp. 1001270B_150601_E10 TaxID=2787079 RepID=UPI0018A07312|nr:TetR/AcrR family transcriptional regulator [Paenibacillus sp. 1001270B_150601_E10]